MGILLSLSYAKLQSSPGGGGGSTIRHEIESVANHKELRLQCSGQGVWLDIDHVKWSGVRYPRKTRLAVCPWKRQFARFFSSYRRRTLNSEVPLVEKECVLPLEKSICTIFLVLSETDVKFGGPPGRKRVRCPCRIDLGLLGGDKCYCEALWVFRERRYINILFIFYLLLLLLF